MTYATSLTALADPTRRELVDRLRNGPITVGQLAATMPISRPAVSQHLKVLSDAGLLEVEQKGTRRFYSMSPDGLAALRRYLDALWEDALTAYATKTKEKSDE